MSTIHELGASLAAVLLAAGVGLTTAAPVDAAATSVEARTVLPYVGHYLGRDGHHRQIAFYYDGSHVRNFKINGTLAVGSAPVQGHQVHHTCDHHRNKCIRGHWSWDTTFVGVWNDPRQGHDVSFEVFLYAH
jgi:hypothetical protein